MIGRGVPCFPKKSTAAMDPTSAAPSKAGGGGRLETQPLLSTHPRHQPTPNNASGTVTLRRRVQCSRTRRISFRRRAIGWRVPGGLDSYGGIVSMCWPPGPIPWRHIDSFSTASCRAVQADTSRRLKIDPSLGSDTPHSGFTRLRWRQRPS